MGGRGGEGGAGAAGSPKLLSAYLGLEDATVPQAVGLGNVTGCMQEAGDDAMPIVVDTAVDAATLEPGHFSIRTQSGMTYSPTCATLAPADEPDELRTILIAGPFSSVDDQAQVVEVSGDVLALDGRSYRGVVSPLITRVDAGPGLVYAIADPAGPLCAAQGSTTEVQLAFQGGVTQNDDAEFDVTALPAFHLLDAAGADQPPVAFDDLDDGDNYLVLCVPAEATPTRVTVDPNTVFDPTNNPNTSALEAIIEARN